jgi:hypothetical protein
MIIGKSRMSTRSLHDGTRPDKLALKKIKVEKGIGAHVDNKLNFDEHINAKIN